MLIQFLVENFLSFRDETVFSMLAPPEETRAAIDVSAHDLRLMRIAAFYGANASGKSNLIDAMETARHLIAYEQSSEAKLPANPFRLAADTPSKPSRFQFDFITGDVRYSYALIITSDAVMGEALYRTLPHTAKEEMVYEREGQSEDGAPIVQFGPMVEITEKDRQFAEFTARGTHCRQLILTRFAKGNVPGFAPILEWFREDLTVIHASARYANLVRELYDDAAMVGFYGKTLAKWGTGVSEVNVEKKHDASFSQFLREYNEVIQVPKAKELISSLILGAPSADVGLAMVGDADDSSLLELKLTHASRSGYKALFRLQDESDGTRRLLHLLPVLFHQTRKSGLCTIIDELDRSLHTALTRHFVREFLEMTSDTHTQLIFTTHDTNLLNGRLLPPRAIWFVEKDDDGASRSHSLSEYDPAQLEYLLEHLEEGYLQGRFGAIPFFADCANLNWNSRSGGEQPKV